jgi:hypothetical protein
MLKTYLPSPRVINDVSWLLYLPEGAPAPLPADIQVKLPHTNAVPANRLHLLAYIPWDERYVAYVPRVYREFFSFVVPFLHARTTDVHTALSTSYVAELVRDTPQPVHEKILHLAVILHDAGWGQMQESEIAASLNYSSVAYSDDALEPKERHATLGAEMAHKILAAYPGDLGLTPDDETFIADLVYYHDQIRPWPATAQKPAPIEYLLLGDADRLWSYTHENFWLDTVRKGVPAARYVRNLHGALEDYFLTDQGRRIARRLIREREAEVAQLADI